MRFNLSRLFLALGGCLLLSPVAVPTAVQAQESVLQDVLQSVGLTPSRKEEIEYRERAPLVVPPSVGQLPAPQAEKSAKSDPAWPTDPDVERRRKQAEEDRVYAGKDYKSYLNRGNPWINPDELRSNRREGAGLVTEPVATNHDGRTVVSPDELRRGNPAMANRQNSMVEPPRRRLTDPPPGYRQPVAVTNADGSVSVPEAEPKKGFFSKINPFSKN